MIIALDARPLVHRQVGGVEQRGRNIFNAWLASDEMSREHQFHLIYARPEKAELFDGSVLAALPENFRPHEISSYHMPSRLHLGTRVFNALARTLRTIKADVYHAFTPLAPRTATCPVVPTIHDLSFELDPTVRRTLEGRELRWMTQQGVDYASRLIAISSQTKDDIVSIYGMDAEHVDVVYNGIDPVFTPSAEVRMLQSVHRASRISGTYLLTVGADIPRRNYSRMLAAMRQVWESGSKALWVLAGRDNWQASNIYTEARKAGVIDKMRFVTSPSNRELADLYRGAAITCCASSFEGFGLSVLESMACGVAVACSDMQSLREVAGEAAVYFPHDDAEAMGQAIEGLLEDAEYRRQLKYRGLHRASLFTWTTAAQLTLESLTRAAMKS
ncbi:MAG: glycosyltransferase family 4 protein [Phycisphaerales bacterium]|nr:glycosyltransferase family 4 protein [Phycisphaerales bacterium]